MPEALIPAVAPAAANPSGIRATRSTAWGCAEPQPVRVGKPHIFVQRAGRKVRELAYVFSDDGFRAPDLSIASEHITRSGIVAIAYQGQPQTIVWFVRADGVLIGDFEEGAGGASPSLNHPVIGVTPIAAGSAKPRKA